MALIDPCVALPFDTKGGLADEREANDRDDDQPLTPTTPTTPSSIADTMTSPDDAPSTPSSAESAPLSGASSSASISSSSGAMNALPTVLQSVFSYIFTDHHQQHQHQQPHHQQQQQQHVLQQQQLHQQHQAHAHDASHQLGLLSPLPFPAAAGGAAAQSYAHLLPHPLSPSPSGGAHAVSPAVAPLSPSSSPAPSLIPLPQARPGRQCCILDLDETLLHSFFPDKVTPYQYQYMVMRCKQQEDDERQARLAPSQRTLYQVDVGDGTIVVLMLRPHLRPFLQSLFQLYDVGVWSAGGKLYVDAICRVLFPLESQWRPLFQLCWDDVQVETNGLSSYTKPLTTLISRYASLELHSLFLVDNRKENGLHFPAQLVVAPDYLPRPWEWNGERDKDGYLQDDAMLSIADCVHSMALRERDAAVLAGPVRLSGSSSSSIGVALISHRLTLSADASMEEDDDDEDESDMGLDDAEPEADIDEVEVAVRRDDYDEDESDMDDDDQRAAAVPDCYVDMVDEGNQQRSRAARRVRQQRSAA